MIGEIERVLDALNRAGVRYLVVGGVAVVLHGSLRFTADLDLVLQLETGNVAKAMHALGSLGYRPKVPVPIEAFSDPAARDAWIREKNMIVFSLWNPSAPQLVIDVFPREPFPFDDVYSRSVRLVLAATEVSVIGLEDLIAMKMSAGRTKDFEDVASLRAVRDSREEEGDPSRG